MEIERCASVGISGGYVIVNLMLTQYLLKVHLLILKIIAILVFNLFTFLIIKGYFMKNFILSMLILVLATVFAISQQVRIEMPIKATGGVVADTLDNGQIVSLQLSSDDAEQENDEVDSPYDDDLDAGWEGAPDDQNILTMGLRFRDLGIPPGSTINEAYLRLHTHEGKGAEDVAILNIWAEATDSAATFDEANFNNDYLLTDRPRTNAQVTWTVAEEWKIWTGYNSPDISAVIQEVVDRPGWKYGNPIAIIVGGENQGPSEVENAREFNSFENIADPGDTDENGNPGDGQNHPERVPRLIITYTPPQSVRFEIPIKATGGVVSDTLDNGSIVSLQLSSDDAEQENDEVDSPYDDDLDAGWEGAPDDQNILTMGLRFRDVFIPKEATIDSAYLYMHTHEGKGAEDVAALLIWGEAADSAATFDEEGFNNNYLLTDRPRTNAEVEWTVAEEWKIWTGYYSTDISSIITEIIQRPGWKQGNPIALIVGGQNQGPSEVENAREFNSFENIADPGDTDENGNPGDGQNHPERVPRLIVNYTVGDVSVRDMFEAHPELELFPNPVQEGNVTLQLEELANSEIEVYNQSGNLVQQYSFGTMQEVELSTENLNTGVYYIKVVQNGNVYSSRLIVNK